MKRLKLTQVKKLAFFGLSFHRDFFVEAIETCPPESTEELSQFYQNRAAAWESLVKFRFMFFFSKLRIYFL
jgi:hypothetical protein